MQPNPPSSTAHVAEEEEHDEDFCSTMCAISTTLNTSIKINCQISVIMCEVKWWYRRGLDLYGSLYWFVKSELTVSYCTCQLRAIWNVQLTIYWSF